MVYLNNCVCMAELFWITLSSSSALFYCACIEFSRVNIFMHIEVEDFPFQDFSLHCIAGMWWLSGNPQAQIVVANPQTFLILEVFAI